MHTIECHWLTYSLQCKKLTSLVQDQLLKVQQAGGKQKICVHQQQ
jgi:hypothetical protein